MNLSIQYKQQVIQALFDNRDKFGGNDGQYAKKYGISQSYLNKLKNKAYRKDLWDQLNEQV